MYTVAIGGCASGAGANSSRPAQDTMGTPGNSSSAWRRRKAAA
jgi:hypothetical protein